MQSPLCSAGDHNCHPFGACCELGDHKICCAGSDQPWGLASGGELGGRAYETGRVCRDPDPPVPNKEYVPAGGVVLERLGSTGSLGQPWETPALAIICVCRTGLLGSHVLPSKSQSAMPGARLRPWGASRLPRKPWRSEGFICSGIDVL